jgi:transposase-like protein
MPSFRLTRPVHRDLAHIYSRWSEYFKLLSSEAFALLIILEGLRTRSSAPDQFHFSALAGELGVSPNTLRRWLAKLKKAGLLTTRLVPGTHSTEASFRLHLPPNRMADRASSARRKRNAG